MGDNILAERIVFVSYAHEDKDRIKPIISYFAELGFLIWTDEQIHAGSSFRLVIQEALDSAACVIVFWTSISINSKFVFSEVERAKKRGILVPLKLDLEAMVPVGFSEMHNIEIFGEFDPKSSNAKTLVRNIKRVLKVPAEIGHAGTLADNDWIVSQTDSATAELRRLVSKIGKISQLVLLVADSSSTICGALAEVEKTYKSVLKAIQDFIEPALDGDSIKPISYAKLARRSLSVDIRKGRGHCKRILAYYATVGGLREKLLKKKSEDELVEIDEIFGRLGTADGDLFRQLEDIGQILTNESRVIVGLFASGQNKQGRQHIIAANQKLGPLED